jgi:hypothetical protein
MIVWFADIGGVVDYYYLSFLFIIIIKDCIFYLSTFNLENDQVSKVQNVHNLLSYLVVLNDR